MLTRLGRGLLGAILGVLPGVILVLLADFVITGEWQLTIGSWGIMLGVIGAVAGAITGLAWPRRPRGS